MKCYEGSETTKAFIEKDCGSGTACMKSHAHGNPEIVLLDIKRSGCLAPLFGKPKHLAM